MLESIAGLDHVVVAVRDLERAAADWRSLGFTLSARGTHSAHVGTANCTIMLDDDYVELLGVLADTPRNRPTREFLARREGVERVAFTALDAAAGVAELRALGIAASDPVEFGRPVELPGGESALARFDTFDWPIDQRPAGVRLFACQHHTRAAVWIPQLRRHANAATRIERIEMLSRDPRAAAALMARLIGAAATRETDGAWRVPPGEARAGFVFVDRDALARRYPGVATGDLAEEGAAALVLRVADLRRTGEALGSVPAARSAGRLVVPASHACGLLLAFEAG